MAAVYILQCTGQPQPQGLIWSQMAVGLGWRSPISEGETYSWVIGLGISWFLNACGVCDYPDSWLPPAMGSSLSVLKSGRPGLDEGSSTHSCVTLGFPHRWEWLHHPEPQFPPVPWVEQQPRLPGCVRSGGDYASKSASSAPGAR